MSFLIDGHINGKARCKTSLSLFSPSDSQCRYHVERYDCYSDEDMPYIYFNQAIAVVEYQHADRQTNNTRD